MWAFGLAHRVANASPQAGEGEAMKPSALDGTDVTQPLQKLCEISEKDKVIRL